MAANICCCLFAFFLSCKVTAGLMHEVAEEERSVVLRCPLSEERRVTWSRERNDSREEILTADGGRLIRHDDINKQYTAYDDLSLYIYRAAVSHSGTYFCDNKAAVALTVIPSDRKTTRTPPPKTTTTSLTTRTAATAAAAPEEILAADHLWHMTVRTLIGLLYLIIMISITAVTRRKARQIQKRDTAADSDL
ncbi:uncharacterized protein LOC113015394 isoform X3 [Astatotilapia calliptera]|uniref:uncharacterized protein LOC113015394 isoform X3 n=1 Tax=Astatotilapia calliptera TaxID=8154 RepID=UPI000E41D6D8|nr:uncharacterized protein LOC113015394 isoform X3 [Astatotilapia calliptera]